ncbi:MAG: AAA family ATPase [Peptoniphilaceae bacterium]
MIFIKKIELKNFQSHKETSIEFDRGLNVILGNSDSGKTAIIRSLKWALYNEPQGDYFIMQGEKDVSVTIYFNTGAILRRYRSPSKNTYYLKKSDGEEFNFDGFGKNIPKEIIDEISIQKINLDNSNNSMINIAEQLEGPFLLNEKTSVRASAIGRLVGVNYIDDALRETIRDNKNLLNNLKSLEIRKEKLKENLLEFNFIENEEKKLSEIILLRNQIKEKNLKLDYLKNLKETYDFNSKESEKQRQEVNKFKNLDLSFTKFYNLSIKIKSLQNFNNLNNKFKNNEREIAKNTKLFNKFKNLDYIATMSDDLEKKVKLFNITYKLNYNYTINYKALKETNLILKKLQNIDELISKYNKLKNKINLYNNLYNTNINFQENKRSLEVGKKYLKKLDGIDESILITNRLNLLLNKFNYLITINNKMKNLDKDISYAENELKIKDNNLDQKATEYEEYFLSLGYCPMCFSEINKDKIKHIREHYKE